MKKTVFNICVLLLLIAMQSQSTPVSANVKHNILQDPVSNTLIDRGGFSCEYVTVVDQTECEALIAFYNSTNGSSWEDKTNWTTNVDISTWYGITVFDNHVTQIVLYDNNLSGQIPPEIGQLTHLIRLELFNNSITGPIPTQFANLINLNYLDISQNQLEGEIPSEFGNLIKLVYLYLGDNSFEGPIPQSFRKLTILSLFEFTNTNLCEPPNIEFIAWKNTVNTWNSNGVFCPLCEVVTDVPKIECEALGLLFKNTSGSGWDDFTNWWMTIEVGKWYGVTIEDNHVTQLELTYNNLDGQLPSELGNLSHLKTLKLGVNKLKGEIPPELGNITPLELLLMGQNHLTGPIPPQLGDLSMLGVLFLSDNQLSGEIPASLGNLNNLAALFLAKNDLNGRLPPELADISNLGLLAVNDNQALIGPIPMDFVNLSNLHEFGFYSTGLCEPDQILFQDWKNTVDRWLGTNIICRNCYLPLILNP